MKLIFQPGRVCKNGIIYKINFWVEGFLKIRFQVYFEIVDNGKPDV